MTSSMSFADVDIVMCVGPMYYITYSSRIHIPSSVWIFARQPDCATSDMFNCWSWRQDRGFILSHAQSWRSISLPQASRSSGIIPTWSMWACKWSSPCFLWYVICWPLWSLKTRQNGCIPESVIIHPVQAPSNITYSHMRPISDSLTLDSWPVLILQLFVEREREFTEDASTVFFPNVR